MQAYSRSMIDFVALKLNILIVKRLSYGKNMSSNLAFMPVANKVGQKVKKFILRFFFGNIQEMIIKSGIKFHPQTFFG